MISAETASGHRQLRRVVFPAKERQELVQDVALVLQVPQHAMPRMCALVVPALGIDGIGTEDLQFAAFDLGRQHADHRPIFVLEKLPHGCGKTSRGMPA